MSTKIKKTSRKKAGLPPKEKKSLTKVEYARLKKAEETIKELAKPIDTFADELWDNVKVLELQLKKVKEKLRLRAIVSRQNGKRFVNFILIDETISIDYSKFAGIFEEKGMMFPMIEFEDLSNARDLLIQNGITIPMKEVEDMDKALDILEENNIPLPTRKSKKAYIRKVKK